MAHARLRLGFLALAGTLLVAGGCADVPSAPPASLRLEKVAVQRGPSFSVAGGTVAAAVIGPQGGEIATASGHRLVFPAGAVSRPTEIRMRDDGEFVGVRLEPHGLQFPAGRSPVLTLRTGDADLSAYQTVRIVYVGEGGEILEVLRTTPVEGAVVAHLRHFSGYIVSGGRSEAAP